MQYDSEWASPVFWRSEFRNVLALYLRKGILSLESAIQIMKKASSLMDGREYAVSSLDILNLVAQSHCSAYDCEFVALAKQLKIPLITCDKQILEEFPRIAVSLEDYIQ